MTVEVYNPTLAAEWDRVAGECRNATFLHLRGYMDYHSDRFEDMSLVARDDRGRIIALLPANRRGDVLESHGGLTYGGWLMTPRADMIAMMAVWERMTELLKASGIRQLIYKPVPHIYHKFPAEEDLYAMWRAGGELDNVLVSSVIDMSNILGFDMSARRKVRKAVDAGVKAGLSDDWEGYWQVLEDRLRRAHNTRPVHSLAEMELLHSRFPENIKLYTAVRDDLIVSGVVMYITDTTMHCQYIASSDLGLEINALPLLFLHILSEADPGIRYFDFGTSNEDHGLFLNEGLIRQKASFGSRAVAYMSYKINLNADIIDESSAES